MLNNLLENPSPGEIAAPDMQPMAAMGSFPGAEWSRARGFVYFPELNTEREVDSWSRRELMRRTRALYNGVGLVRGIITGIARMVCGDGLQVQSATADPAWDDRMEAIFKRRVASRETFHLARKYGFASSQRAVVRAWLKDGDVLSVFARTPEGQLRTMLYEGNQIGSGFGQASTGFVDGVRLDSYRGALGYRIATVGEDGKESSVEIPAKDAILVTDYERIGQVRGVSCLYHAVNRLLDRGEILAAITHGVKLSSQVGYALESAANAAGPGAGSLSPRRPQITVATPDGPMTLDRLMSSGEIAELQPGQSMRILHDERPHPNVSGLLDSLVRDISIGTGFFPEILWNVAALGGANTRFVMASAQSRIEELQQILVETYCAPIYLAHVADAIAKGEIEYRPDWWAHTWLTPARLTVDFGRDGKLYLEQYKQGHITLRTLYGYRGEDWKTETDDYLDERKYMKEQAAARGLTMEEAYPQFYGHNVGAQNPLQNDDTDDDE